MLRRLVIIMASGGARNRSGPQADPTSGRSDARGLSYDKLPSEGRSGEPPLEWPLGTPSVYIESFENGKPVKKLDEDATDERRDAELALWAEAWTYPQAVAWERDRWRWNIVALWVRTFLVCAGPEAKAADKASLHRFGDQLGLTPAGLRENGWTISRDEVAPKREQRATEPKAAPKRRLRAVGDDG